MTNTIKSQVMMLINVLLVVPIVKLVFIQEMFVIAALQEVLKQELDALVQRMLTVLVLMLLMEHARSVTMGFTWQMASVYNAYQPTVEQNNWLN